MKQIKSFIQLFLFLLIPVVFIFCSNTSEPKNDPYANENDIINFSLDNVPEAHVSIDKEEKTIRLLFPYRCKVDIKKLTIKFGTSMKATTNLLSGGEYDFTNPQTLIITSASGIENKYLISAEICSKTAIVVSDTQNDIIPLYNQNEFFQNINVVIDKAHEVGIPTYYVMLTSLIINNDSSAWNLPDQLHRYDDGILIEKDNIINAFDYSTILHNSLLERGIGKVIIVGVSSMGCVIGTCRGAAELNYDVTLIRNAHGEPIGYRPESSVELCNTTFMNENLGTLLLVNDLSF